MVSSAAAASSGTVSLPVPSRSSERNAATMPGSPQSRNLNGWRAPPWTAPVLSFERSRLNVWAAPKTLLFSTRVPGCWHSAESCWAVWLRNIRTLATVHRVWKRCGAMQLLVHRRWMPEGRLPACGTALDGIYAYERSETHLSTVRGRGRNVEIAVDRALPAAGEELRAHFTERPDFYRGSHAVANLGLLEPGAPEISAFRDLLAEFGITLDGVSGSDTLAETLANLQLAYLGAAPVAEVSALPRARTTRQIELSPGARPLVCDFARARADLAQRRFAKTGPATGPAGVAPSRVASG